MEAISLEQFGKPDKAGLRKFLGYCQQLAVDRAHPILASITLPSEYLDPLAVLQTVNDLNSEHCYLERSAKHEGVACAESVLTCEKSGPDRFQQAKAFIQQWKEYAVFIGDDSLPWAGPHFFCSAAFEDDFAINSDDLEPFFDHSLHLFLPRWQVGWSGAKFSATANLIVEADTPLDLLIGPIWRAHERFTSFEFVPDATNTPDIPDASECQITNQVQSESGYVEAVNRALACIEAGDFQKIVISRKLDISTKGRFIPLELLNKLRTKYPDCRSFSFQNKKGESFIGASPERLLKVSGGKFETEALAGSIERGESARQDAYFSRQLLSSEKDRMEHGLVLHYIQETLEALGLSYETDSIPEILQLSNIQHLRVPLRGTMTEDIHILDLVEKLHPTPALGGYPKKEALAKLRNLEAYNRDRYGGLTGWLNLSGDGEFTVNIRCARVNHNEATLYGGAGIVAGSEAEKELRETELKLISMLPNFINLD